MRTILLLLLLSVIWPIPASHANLTGEYTALERTGLDHLSITQTGQEIHGFMQVVQVTTRAPGYSSQTLTVTGTVDDGAISITGGGGAIEQLFGGDLSRVTGANVGGHIVLRFPNTDGTISKLIFTRMSAERWNSAVQSYQTVCVTRFYENAWVNAINNEVGDVNRALEEASAKLPAAQQAVESYQVEVDKLKTQKQAIISKLADDDAVLKTKQNEQTALQLKANKTGNEQDGMNAENAGMIVEDQLSQIEDDQSEIEDVNGNLDQANYNLKIAQATLDHLNQQQTGALAENKILEPWVRDEYKRIAPLVSTASTYQLPLNEITVTRNMPIYSRPVESKVYLLSWLGPGSRIVVIRCSAQWLMMLDTGNAIRWVPSP